MPLLERQVVLRGLSNSRPPGSYNLKMNGAIGNPTSYDIAVPNVVLISDKQGSVVLHRKRS
jgi:hypothetical protein